MQFVRGELLRAGLFALAVILDAAVWCVEKSGLSNVTIDDIVNECGFSRATVYRRYRNRESLLTELVRCYIEPYEERGKQILSGPESFADRIIQRERHGAVRVPARRGNRIDSGDADPSPFFIVLPLWARLMRPLAKPPGWR